MARPGGGVKVKSAGAMGMFSSMAVKVKSVMEPSVSSSFMDWMMPAGSDDEGEETDALGHALGDAGDGEVGASWGDGEGVEFLGELGVAEQEPEGRAEVVELLGGSAGDLRVAGGEEPGELAVEDEELAGGRVVAPAHTAGLLEQEGAGLGAVEAHAGVVLGVAGAEGGEVVVVVVDAVDEGGVELGVGGLGSKQQEGKGSCRDQAYT